MKRKFFIGNKLIKEYSDVFIIAEAGVNHNGNLAKALELIDIASKARADAVKFQTFKAEQLVVKQARMAQYQKKNLDIKQSQYQMLKKLELPEVFYQKIIEHCRKKGIMFLSTPHGGVDSVDFLEKMKIKAYKIGSADLTNYLLLERVAKTKKPVILSTGMSTMIEVKDAIKFLQKYGTNKIVVLHCTTSYPCKNEEVNLLAMKTMMDSLPVPVGYSDHSNDIKVAIMAATLGAAVYECHFTIDKKLPGPDHVASSDPKELKEKIEAIRKVKIILGKGIKFPQKCELRSMKSLVRKSIVAGKNLLKGHLMEKDDLKAKRPGDGLSPIHFQKIIGKKLNKTLKKDQKINFCDLE